MFAELGTDSLGGKSADQSKALLDGVLRVPAPGLALALCSNDGTTVSMKNTSYPSLWSYPYFVLATFTLGQGYSFLLRYRWVNGGD